jgi:hypothetical protein
VDLPSYVTGPYEVFVNGVPQREGVDYELRPGALAFKRHLEKEGKLGFWRWFAMFMSLFGTYRKNDSVDVVYQRAGKRVVATGLTLEPF